MGFVAFGVPIGVEIGTTNDGVTPAFAAALEMGFVEGTEDDEAGAIFRAIALFHDVGIEVMVFTVTLASCSDSFSESFFLITWSRSEHAVWYSFLYLSASASSASMSLRKFGVALHSLLESMDLLIGVVEFLT